MEEKKIEKTEKKEKPNLFNTLGKAILENMDPEDVEKYSKMGEYMYSTTDFQASIPKPKKSMEDDMVDGVFYVEEALKAGLHPQDMEKKQVQLMYEIYGEKWYEKYGYTKDEVPEPEVAEKNNKDKKKRERRKKKGVSKIGVKKLTKEQLKSRMNKDKKGK